MSLLLQVVKSLLKKKKQFLMNQIITKITDHLRYFIGIRMQRTNFPIVTTSSTLALRAMTPTQYNEAGYF